ncbi:hypothetical protein RMCBS344292_17331 [Rhizopus microsporus]|nr:hypothetical protein RMCBS344292_17331 [Rhizopus microsporus]
MVQKRNVQLVNTVNNPYESTVDVTYGFSGTGGSNGIYGVDNSRTDYANDSDETDSDASENEFDARSTESLVTEVTDETSKYSTVDYSYNLQHMRMSAPLKAPVAVNGIVFECIFDSGASVSVMNEGLARKLGLQYNGNQMHEIGFDSMQRESCNIAVNVPFRIAGHLRSEHVCTQADQRPNQKGHCILGMTWFSAYGVSADLHNNTITFPVFLRRDANGTLIFDPHGPKAVLQGYFTHENAYSSNSSNLSLAVEPSASAVDPKEALAVSVVQANPTIIVNQVDNNKIINNYTDDILSKSSEEGEQDFHKSGEESICLDEVPDFLRELVSTHSDCFVEFSSLGRVDIVEHEIPIHPCSIPMKPKSFRLS